MNDIHVHLSFEEAREQGCTCEFGCPVCGLHASQMGNCLSWAPCPVGREADSDCPLSRQAHKAA